MSYPLDKCYFCNSDLLITSYCSNEDCYNQHMYCAIKETQLHYGEIGFKIQDYGFHYYSSGEMDVCILNRGVIKEVIELSNHIYVDLENYLQVVERANKLKIYK